MKNQKRMLGIYTILVATLFAGITTAYSAPVTPFPTKVDIIGIRVYSGENPGHFIKVTDIGYWEQCPLTNGSGIYFLPAGSKEAFSLLLTAKASNQKVWMSVKGYDECHGGPNNGAAVIFEVQLGDF